MNNKTKACQKEIKRKSKISRNWKHFLRAEQQKPTRMQVKVQTVCKIPLRNLLHHRIMVLLDLEFRFKRDTVGFVLDQNSRPPRDDVPAIVTASATVSATTSTRNSNSPPTKKSARDSTATCKSIYLFLLSCSLLINYELNS